ncbi:MAG: ROK family transcriptional regulator [Propionivibrio sp.]
MKAGGKPKNLKQNNSRAVFELLRHGEKIAVAEIAEKIRLSKTTIKKVFDSLLADGLISTCGKGDSTDEGGKKPELYRLNPQFGYVIAIHVTPDQVRMATTDLSAEITWRENVPIGAERSFDGLIERFATTIERIVREKAASAEKLLGVVLVLTGLVDPERGVSIHSFFYPDWGRDAPVVDRLHSRLGTDFDTPIFVDNTNRYQALAESERGLAGDCRNFIIVDALSEGLGAGIVVNGRLLHGRQSIAGEIGHMTLDPHEGFPCVCGSTGCFEAMVSERRITALARQLAPSFPGSVLDAKNGAITLHDICAGVVSGDALCRRLIDDVARWYVAGLGNVIMANDPELIVLQGIYTQAGPYFLERVRAGLRHIGLPQVEKSVEVAYSQLDDDRGVIGGALHVIAAYLANHAY